MTEGPENRDFSDELVSHGESGESDATTDRTEEELLEEHATASEAADSEGRGSHGGHGGRGGHASDRGGHAGGREHRGARGEGHEGGHGGGMHAGHEEMFKRRFFVAAFLSIPVLLYSPHVQELLNFSAPAFSGSE